MSGRITVGEAEEAAAVRENTKLIWLETPTNPATNITDIAEVVKHKGNAQSVRPSTSWWSAGCGPRRDPAGPAAKQ